MNATARHSAPRVWLAGAAAPVPADQPTVRDDRMCTWCPGRDGCYHTADGQHRATWDELRRLSDLVELS